ncbi:MAG: DNA polymerase III subunit chi [Calditrichaceae bacterium]
MAKTSVTFIELKITAKERYICQIVEKLFNKNLRTTVYVADKKAAFNLDNLLWNWKQESFVPHSIMNDPSMAPEDPVIITSNESFPALTDALILYDPLPVSKFEGYRYIIDFAEIYDNTKLVESRKRYAAFLHKEEYELSFMQLGAFLNGQNKK